MAEKFYTSREAAAFLGVHPQTVKNWKTLGRLVPTIEREHIAFYSETYLKGFKAKNGKGAVAPGKKKSGKILA